ncbi:hypothetical protein GCM10007874_46000 [Labrys miyagiensis]|uniref:Nucleotidyl transferase AbiEii toxin, Type IV TA system n=2 Tax=Labrys miyagiensis TaxID=346912 RepID=A0ABQ6CMN5_9HYPH|nr:hypothetical protein GCM10007874_46000 [Labrys miyagiensis]
MVYLGLANTRLKDFYDIWVLRRTHAFEGDRLARAFKATFARRKTEIPRDRPDALTAAFANDPTKVRQWKAFIQDVAIDPGTLSDVVEALADFLLPRAQEARNLEDG